MHLWIVFKSTESENVIFNQAVVLISGVFTFIFPISFTSRKLDSNDNTEEKSIIEVTDVTTGIICVKNMIGSLTMMTNSTAIKI